MVSLFFCARRRKEEAHTHIQVCKEKMKVENKILGTLVTADTINTNVDIINYYVKLEIEC